MWKAGGSEVPGLGWATHKRDTAKKYERGKGPSSPAARSEETQEALTSNINEATQEPNRVQREEQGQVFPADSEGVPVVQLQVRVHRKPQVLLNLLAQLVQQMLLRRKGELLRTTPTAVLLLLIPRPSQRKGETDQLVSDLGC